MSRRARTRRDKRAPQPDFDDDTTAAYGGGYSRLKPKYHFRASRAASYCRSQVAS